MTIRYPEILGQGIGPAALEWSERDSMLYALTLGLGQNPLNERSLRFVTEGRRLEAVPSMWGTIARHFYPDLRDIGLDYKKTVHVGERVQLHAPVPTSGRFLGAGRVQEVYDLAERGALVVLQIEMTDASSKLLATVQATLLARADGGCGGSPQAPPQRHPIPTRPADQQVQYQTPPDVALIYRLLGDFNPLHADPAVARSAGFARPILHGLCTYGILCRVILESQLDFEPGRIQEFEAAFTAPVFPGDELTVDLWRDESTISFTARARVRAKVIDHGRCGLAIAQRN